MLSLQSKDKQALAKTVEHQLQCNTFKGDSDDEKCYEVKKHKNQKPNMEPHCFKIKKTTL